MGVRHRGGGGALRERPLRAAGDVSQLVVDVAVAGPGGRHHRARRRPDHYLSAGRDDVAAGRLDHRCVHHWRQQSVVVARLWAHELLAIAAQHRRQVHAVSLRVRQHDLGAPVRALDGLLLAVARNDTHTGADAGLLVRRTEVKCQRWRSCPSEHRWRAHRPRPRNHVEHARGDLAIVVVCGELIRPGVEREAPLVDKVHLVHVVGIGVRVGAAHVAEDRWILDTTCAVEVKTVDDKTVLGARHGHSAAGIRRLPREGWRDLNVGGGDVGAVGQRYARGVVEGGRREEPLRRCRPSPHAAHVRYDDDK
eukprot:PhM_4_TR2885/c0_g1_i1/m.44399